MPLTLDDAQTLKKKLAEKYNAVSDRMTIDVWLPEDTAKGYGIHVCADGNMLWSEITKVFKDAKEMTGTDLPTLYSPLFEEDMVPMRGEKIGKDMAAGLPDSIKPLKPLKLKKSG